MTINGKHMICDIRHIEDIGALNTNSKIEQIIEIVCEYNELSILNKRIVPSSGFNVLYKLTESYIILHTFPEIKHLVFDFYTSLEYDDIEPFNLIYDFLLLAFQANSTLSSMEITDINFDEIDNLLDVNRNEV